MRGAFGTFAGEQPLGVGPSEIVSVGSKSSKNLDWKVRWLFCGVFFWSGEVRILVEAKMLKGRCVKGSEFILVIFHPTG